MSELVRVLSRRAQAVDWRPHTHDSLYRLDHHFDSCFNAVLRCESYVQSLYTSTIESHHTGLVEVLLDDVRQSVVKTRKGRTSLSCVTTSLSDPDRGAVLDMCVSRMANGGTHHLVVDIPCLSCSSAHDILVEVAEGARQRLEKRAEADRRRAVKASGMMSAPAKASFAALLARLTDAPLHALASMAAEYAQQNDASETAASAAADVASAGGVPFAVVILRHAEKIDPEALSSLLNLLRLSAAHLRLHLVAFNSAIVPLPLRLSKTGQSLIDVSIHASEAPWELYDDLMSRLFAAREVPVSLPSNLIAWIHESFWRSQGCVKAACDKVLLSLAHHFSSRRALLCMFEETQWLLDMKLCRRPVGAPHKTAEDNKLIAISQLMEYLGADDVAGTGIRLALQSDLGSGRGGLQGRATEVLGAQAILQRSIERMRLDREWFLRLKRLRDTFLAPHPSSSSSSSSSFSSSSAAAAASASAQRCEYCSDILWAAVRAGGRMNAFAPSEQSKTNGGSGRASAAPHAHTRNSTQAQGQAGTECLLISDLINASARAASRVPVAAIHATVEEFKKQIEGLQAGLPLIFAIDPADSDDEDDDGPSSSSSSSASGARGRGNALPTPTPCRTARHRAMEQARALQCGLEDHCIMFEEIVDMLGKYGVSLQTPPAQLPKVEMRTLDAVGAGAGAGGRAGEGSPSPRRPPPSTTASSSAAKTKARAKAKAAAAAAAGPVGSQDSFGSGQTLDGRSPIPPGLSPSPNPNLSPNPEQSVLFQSPERETRTRSGTAFSSTLAKTSVQAKAGGAVCSPSNGPRQGQGLGQGQGEGEGVCGSPPSRSLLSPGPRSPRPTPRSASSGSRIRALQLASPGTPGVVFAGSIFRFVEIALEDFLEWLRALGAFVDSLPRPAPLLGIVDVSPRAVSSILAAASTSVRAKVVSVLLAPPDAFPINPDVSVLADIALERGGQRDNLYEWLDDFEKNCDDWAAARAGGKKRRRREEEAANDGGAKEARRQTDLRCRFIRALNDLEHTGVVGLKGGVEVRRLAYAWTSNG